MQVDALSETLESSEAETPAYTREALGAFLAEADAERERLLAVIDDARGRARRALALDRLQQTMVEMLVETQRELFELQAQAERDAAEVLGAAEQEALEIVRETRQIAGASSDPGAPGAPEAHAATELHAADDGGSHHSGANNSSYTTTAASIFGPSEDDRYFAYLREALVDDQPLGPRLD